MKSSNRVATYILMASLLALSGCVFGRGWGHDDRYGGRRNLADERPGSDASQQYRSAGLEVRYT